MKEPVHRDLHSRNYPVDEDMVLQRKVRCLERLGWYGLVALIGPLQFERTHTIASVVSEKTLQRAFSASRRGHSG